MELAEVMTYDRVPRVPQFWLQDGVLPGDDVVVVGGDSEVGKGTLGADWTARITNGLPWPDGSESGPPGRVIIISSEEKAAATAYKLDAAGADCTRVINLSNVERESVGAFGAVRDKFTLPDDIDVLRRELTRQRDVRMVWIDPIMGVSGIAMGNDIRVRRLIVEPLQSIAEEYGVCIVIVAHPNKGVKPANLKDGIGGSKGLTNSARVVVGVIRDEADPDVRLIVRVKNNLAGVSSAPPVRFRIVDGGGAGKVEYLEAPATSDLLDDRPGEPQPGTGKHRVLQVLRKHGAAGGTGMSSQTIAAEGDLSHSDVRVYLHRLVSSGLVDNPARNTYCARTHANAVTGVTNAPSNANAGAAQ